MLKFKLITDSSCGISQEDAKKMGIIVLPLTLSFQGKDYKDGIDISTNDFYNLFFESVEKSKLRFRNLFNREKLEFPKTSLVQPLTFEETFKQVIADGYVPVVLPIAACLSGTYQAACIARDMLEDEEIYVIDSKTALGCVKVMMEYLSTQEFENAKDLLDEIEYIKEHMNFYAIPEDLEFLHKGGRLSKGKAVIGNVLQLKPVIQLDVNGKLNPVSNVRGLRHSYMKCAEFIKEFPVDTKYPMGYGYSTKEENIKNFIELTKEATGKEVAPCQISPVVGAHVGPGAVAIFYVSTKKVVK